MDLDRPRLVVLPGAEWAQMYRHAWRLQRDQFWSEDMQDVDWQRVYRRYWPLVDRVATRAEFSDLMWEMQGELGTSHAYEFGGDYKPEPSYDQGFLAADCVYDDQAGGYRIAHIVRGDPWEEDDDLPLREPGLNIAEGDVLLAVAGHRLSQELTPQQALVNHAGEEVLLSIAGQNGDKPRTVTVKTLKSERSARYREWVEANRLRVHEATGGRVGYLHIPDMGPRGYAEFHRAFLAEVVHPGLIVDVRYNGGGHVSQLLLEKLARRRIGYDVQRWGRPSSLPVVCCPGSDGGDHERARGLRWRYLQPRIQANEARPAGRQAHLGRCDRHLAARSLDRRRHHDPARVLFLVRRRRLGRRKLRHRPGHRGRGHARRLGRRPRPAAWSGR